MDAPILGSDLGACPFDQVGGWTVADTGSGDGLFQQKRRAAECGTRRSHTVARAPDEDLIEQHLTRVHVDREHEGRT